ETNDESYRLIQKPVESLRQLREDPVRLENLELSNEKVDLSQEDISGKAFEMIVEIEPGDAETVGINMREAENQRTVIGYDSVNQSVFVDRNHSGESGFFEGFEQRNDAPVNLSDGTVKIRIFVDWSSVEVFVNDGSRVITKRIFPDPESIGVSAFADGGSASITNIEFWPLESIWTETALD
ncbi:MAG: glycoside hydrolase family 32 protein, partial [Bacteroidetes bacterium]|nr:glycoside hydrolase family 32 protein [Bacteroidota bacterium]